MRVAQLVARGRRRFRVTTDSAHAQPIARNHLARRFTVAEPNRVWAADATALPTREGWCYLAGILDLRSRRVVGLGHRSSTRDPRRDDGRPARLRHATRRCGAHPSF
jgi:transposase InsO family protein